MPRSDVPGPRSTVLTSGNRRGCRVMACWHRSWQRTQPPASARRRRIEPNATNASTAATAAPPAATAIAAISAATSKKCAACRPNTSSTTSTTAAIMPAGRA